MLFILQQIYGVFSAIVGFVYNIWNAFTSFALFVYRIFTAIPLYFVSMPTWILPVVSFGFLVGIVFLLIGRR